MTGRLARRRLVPFIVLAVIMLRHILMDSYGPFDRVMEFLVLIFVGYEVIHGWLKEREDKKRREMVDARIARLREAISNGDKLKKTIPGLGSPTFGPWRQEVNAWIAETGTILKSFSSQAEVAFHQTDPKQIPTVGMMGTSQEVIELFAHLTTLRQIMEKPDIYF